MSDKSSASLFVPLEQGGTMERSSSLCPELLERPAYAVARASKARESSDHPSASIHLSSVTVGVWSVRAMVPPRIGLRRRS